MDWVVNESLWVDCPLFANEFVGREAPQGLEPFAEIVSSDEVGQMLA